MANNVNSHNVVANPNGGWAVKRSGAKRASGHYPTQASAVNAGREISRNQGTELIVHGKNGKIRFSDSHGRDPFPPKG